MFHAFWFLHLFGLSIWMGSFVAMLVSVMLVRKMEMSEELRRFFNKAQRAITMIGNAAAVLMLISGGVMLSLLNSRPLWVLLMTQIGGSTILFSTIAVTLQSRRLSNHLASNSTQESLQRQVGLLNLYLWIVTIVITIVLGIVASRI